MNDLETAINSADLTRHHIPVEVEEERHIVGDDTKVWVNLMREEFAGMKAWLSGPDGQSGVLASIKDHLEKLEKGQRQIEDQLSCMASVQIRDKAELDAKIVGVKNDVDSVGNLARGARKAIDDHIEDSEELRRFHWEQALGISGAIVGVAGVVIGLLLGLG